MIELKTDKGRLSAAQKDWQEWAGEFGLPYAVCRSVDEVADILRVWRVPLRTSGVEALAEQGMLKMPRECGAMPIRQEVMI